MHAYLLITQDPELKTQNLEEITNKNSVKKTLEFPLQKIEDVRSLASFTKLKVSEPTAIVIKNIDEATTEALNAFLKNLEEPQENLFYFLTARNHYGIPATIISRCQIIKIKDARFEVKNEEIEAFLRKTTGEKFAYLDKLKDRGEAIGFIEDFIYANHEFLHKTDQKHGLFADNLRAATNTLNALKANGNVTLQLANFVISLPV